MQFTETEQFVKVTRQYNVVEADEVPFMHGYAAARDACRGQK